MKKISLLLFILLQTAFAFSQSVWVIQKIDERLAVQFPDNPTKTTKKGSESYLSKGKDSGQYSAVVLDYKILANLDSATLSRIRNTQQFADQIRGGMAAQKTNYTFEVAKIGTWNTFTTYSFNAVEHTSKARLAVRMILIGSKMYALSCLLPDQLVTANEQRFFDSITLLQ